MVLLRLGLLTLNLDRVATIHELPEAGFRVHFDDGREMVVIEPSDVAALKAWLDGNAPRLA